MRGLKLEYAENRAQYDRSHPSRMRGLKLNILSEKLSELDVASLTDAWIET